MQVQNYYLDYVIDPNFQRIKRLFLSSLEDNTIRTVHTEYLHPKLEIKDYNIVVYGQNVINQSVQNNIRTFEKTLKISMGRGDNYWLAVGLSILQRELQADCDRSE